MNSLNQWAIKAALVSIAILSPVRPVMIAAMILILLDFVTGIWASIKKKVPITSFGMRRTIVKAFAYQGAIVFGFVMETYLLSDIPSVKVIGGLIAITECKSFFENVNVISGVDFGALFLNKLQGKPLEDIEKKLNIPE
jgi:hypothetical protein